MKKIFNRKKPLSPYGMQIKIKLMELSRTQEWLISEVKKRLPPGSYVDSSYINRILTGGVSSGKAIYAINEILGIEKED